jgi:HAD superfamily hydrolase (TIGR01509 family)
VSCEALASSAAGCPLPAAGIRAVLFDFGGTLCTFATLEAAARATCAEAAGWFGADPETVFAAVRAGIGRAFREYAGRSFYLHRELFRQGYRTGFAALGLPFAEEHVARAIATFDARQAEGFCLREGARETLAELRRRGLRLGIVSNGDEAQFAGWVTLGGLQEAVDFVLSSEAARSCKPDAGIFHAALRLAGCEAAEALFVGDTPDHDIAGARAAGLRAVLLRPPETLNLPYLRGAAEPDWVIAALPELLDLPLLKRTPPAPREER